MLKGLLRCIDRQLSKSRFIVGSEICIAGTRECPSALTTSYR